MEQTLYQKVREQYAGQGLQLEGVIFPKEQELVLSFFGFGSILCKSLIGIYF